MKRLSIIFVSLLLTCGCAKKVQAPVPGEINSFDATAYRTLSDAQAAIDSVKQDVNAGTIALSPTQKTVFNQLINDYNIGESAWQAYHAGATNDTTTLTNAIDALVADIAQVATQIQGGGK